MKESIPGMKDSGNSVICAAFDKYMVPVQQALVFDNYGMGTGFNVLLSGCPGAISNWHSLTRNTWCGISVSSTLEKASIWDIILWLSWANANRTVNGVWSCVGHQVWAKILGFVGRMIECFGQSFCKVCPDPLPILKTKHGFSKRLPVTNKVILLNKMQKKKKNRESSMQTHADLVPEKSQLILQEQLIECNIYMDRLKKTFEHCRHIAVSWDPSSYDIETMVAAVYSWETDFAGWLPIQNILPMMANELEAELQALSSAGKITRASGYNELRALSHALQSISKGIDYFQWPEDLRWQPSQSGCHRILVGDRYHLVLTDGTEVPQIPPTVSLKQLPILISCSDQGGINRSCLDHLQYKLQAPIVICFDPNHRVWNDVRDSLKKSPGSLFRCLLEYSLIYNLNYGPLQTREWFQKKRTLLKEFFSEANPNGEPFISYLPLIAAERQLLEPDSPEARETFFTEELSKAKSFQVHGPTVKLMRWFSWWEADQWYRGEVWLSKMVMLHGSSVGPNANIDEYLEHPDFDGMAAHSNNPREQLRQLKIKHGSWALAPRLITVESMWKRQLIFELGSPSWACNSSRAKNVLSPLQVAEP